MPTLPVLLPVVFLGLSPPQLPLEFVPRSDGRTGRRGREGEGGASFPLVLSRFVFRCCHAGPSQRATKKREHGVDDCTRAKTHSIMFEEVFQGLSIGLILLVLAWTLHSRGASFCVVGRRSLGSSCPLLQILLAQIEELAS